MYKTITLLLLFCCSDITILPAQSRNETAVADAVEMLRKAMLSADTIALKNVTAQQLSYGHSSGLVEDKTAFIQEFVDGRTIFKSMDLLDQAITIAGNTALVRHRLTGDTNNKNVPGKVDLLVLQVWQKQHRHWKLLGRQAIKTPQK